MKAALGRRQELFPPVRLFGLVLLFNKSRARKFSERDRVASIADLANYLCVGFGRESCSEGGYLKITF
jgi:hypothetical protein